MWSERTETKEIRDITQEMIKPAPLNSKCDVIIFYHCSQGESANNEAGCSNTINFTMTDEQQDLLGTAV